MEEEKKEKGFVIKDRRLFDEAGSMRQEEEAKPKEKNSETKTLDEVTATPEEKDSQQTGESPLPEINFANFIFSLSTTAMYHFGDFPDPVTKKSLCNLAAAKQTIDILSMLKMKTDGNLDEREKELIDGILYELRMRYVNEMTSK